METLYNVGMAVAAIPLFFILARLLCYIDDRWGDICMVDEYEIHAHHPAKWKDAAAVKHYSQLVVSNPSRQGKIATLIEETFSQDWLEAAARDMEHLAKYGKSQNELTGLGRCQYCGTKVTHLKAHCESCGGAL